MAVLDPIEIVLSMAEEERRTWLPGTVADVFQETPRKYRESLLAAPDPWPLAEVSALHTFEEDEGGGVTSPGCVGLGPETTMDEAISYLRRQAGQIETVYAAYLPDSGRRLPVVSLGARVKSVQASERHEALVRLIADHLPLAIPPINRSDEMRGIVTVDDAMQPSHQNSGRDRRRAGGTEAPESPSLVTPLPGCREKGQDGSETSKFRSPDRIPDKEIVTPVRTDMKKMDAAAPGNPAGLGEGVNHDR